MLIINCNKNVVDKTVEISLQKNAVEDSITEFYVDSVHIGSKGNFKLELKRISCKDSIYADIHLFKFQNNKWVEKQHFAFEKDGILGCDPEYKDFNNDGYSDFTYVSGIAARGANEIRSLFIFDPKKGNLQFIKNSPEFPNLQYNKELDCIDAFSVYGGCSSYFLKISKDSLCPFARIDLFNGYREIYTIKANGKETLIKRDKSEETYLRYKNFSPLEEY